LKNGTGHLNSRLPELLLHKKGDLRRGIFEQIELIRSESISFSVPPVCDLLSMSCFKPKCTGGY